MSFACYVCSSNGDCCEKTINNTQVELNEITAIELCENIIQVRANNAQYGELDVNFNCTIPVHTCIYTLK